MVEKNAKPIGLAALCWDEEDQKYIQFPGETWNGKTWLEQNRIIAGSSGVLNLLIDSVPGPVHLRYLTRNPIPDMMDRVDRDEIGYHFYPGLYDFSFDSYWQSFPGKFRKKHNAEMKKLEARQVSYRFDRIKDLDAMFRMNIATFRDHSYFSDSRFYHAFENLAAFLLKNGMLRVTTVLIGGVIAAVDMGALWKNSYTLLAGGTNPEFPGVAKIINLHHLDWACRQEIGTVDFLCGDFNWKERFHLTSVPFYEFRNDKARIPLREKALQEHEVAFA